jgi:hypothetical protein
MSDGTDFRSFEFHESAHGWTPGHIATAPPDGWIDAGLLAFAEGLGDGLARCLVSARAMVLESGDDESRARLEALAKVRDPAAIVARLRAILSRQPRRGECDAPALVHFTEGELFLALAREVPGAGARATIRIATRERIERGFAGARRIPALPEHVEARWRRLGHAKAPVSMWRCELPACFEGEHDIALEIAPNPSSFNEAMFVAHHGAGRTIVALVHPFLTGALATPTTGQVLPSGWSYLAGEEPYEGHAQFPNGAPLPRAFVCVPDPDLFALCAARTWTGSLADAIWLRRRDDHRALR